MLLCSASSNERNSGDGTNVVSCRYGVSMCCGDMEYEKTGSTPLAIIYVMHLSAYPEQRTGAQRGRGRVHDTKLRGNIFIAQR